MEKYSRVEKPKPESPINENEIRVTTQGLIRNYISYATTLLQVHFFINRPNFAYLTLFLNRMCSYLRSNLVLVHSVIDWILLVDIWIRLVRSL